MKASLVSWVGTALERLIDDDALHRKAWGRMRCADQGLSWPLCAAQMGHERLAVRNAQRWVSLSQTSELWEDNCEAVGRQPRGHGRRQ